MLARRFSWTLVLLTLGLAGCCLHCQRKSADVSEGAQETPSLFPANRGSIDIDLAKLPSPSSNLPGLLPGPDGQHPYWGLTEAECLCQAAANSSLGNMLEGENGAKGRHGKKRSGKAGDVKQNVYFYLAEEARNQSAGAAMDLYYRLAEAEAKWDLLQSSLETTQEVQKEIHKIRQQGLKVTSEVEALERRGLEVQTDQHRLRGAIIKLNGELASLLGWDSSQGLLWPAADFAVVDSAVDTEEAVALGLAQRPQLLLLREVNANLNAQTLPLVRGLLQGVNPLLGLALKVEHPCLGWVLCLGKICSSLHPCQEKAELAQRRRQVQQLLRDREKAVAEEVRQAVYHLRTQTQLVAMARQRALLRRARYVELEERRRQGLASLLEVAPAKLAWSQASSEVVQEVMAWHIAQVRLKQAQGVLTQDCQSAIGHRPPAHRVADSRQPTADSRQPTADSRQPIADSRQPIADNR